VEQPLHGFFVESEVWMNQRHVIRGAISVAEDTRDAIFCATKELFTTIIERNLLSQHEIDAILFSATKDLTSAYPAEAIRQLGWTEIPMMCYQEMAVKDSLAACIRIMMFTNKNEIRPQHVYLHEAEKLRPDLLQEAQNASH
jgi:monofunctional chorismate mutase